VARTIAPAPSDDVDFEQLLHQAVVREAEVDNDDSEGYPFDPVVTPFSSPGPLSPVPDYLSNWLAQNSDSTALPSPPPLSLDSPPLPLLPPCLDAIPSSSSKQLRPSENPKYRPGSAEDIRRKKRANAKRAVKRLEAKRAVPYGDYAVKPRIINKYVRSSTAIGVKFDATKLRHTKHAYTGGRPESHPKKIYSLNELVGNNSRFKFRLERWDGRWVQWLLLICVLLMFCINFLQMRNSDHRLKNKGHGRMQWPPQRSIVGFSPQVSC
jgi:hypothetical protein